MADSAPADDVDAALAEGELLLGGGGGGDGGGGEHRRGALGAVDADAERFSGSGRRF